jgi:hypothetical protein
LVFRGLAASGLIEQSASGLGSVVEKNRKG